MKRVLVLFIALAVAAGCSKAVKQEGFKAMVEAPDEAKLEGTYEAPGGDSCGRFQPDRREVRLRDDRLSMDLVDTPFEKTKCSIALTVDGETFVLDRPGADSTVVIDNPRGRIIGSMEATLVHESAGTKIDGKPAPIRSLKVELTFNLQPCL